MKRAVELTGPWRVRKADGDGEAGTWIDATVPGVVQYDLVAVGQLENPFAGTRAAFDAAWVARSDWQYETEFDAEGAGTYAFVLEFDGIDTFAEVRVNGEIVGTTSNALRSYRFAVAARLLRPQGNTLSVLVHGHESMVPTERVELAREKMGHTDGIEGLLGKSLVRRYQRNFASNSSLLNIGTAVLGIGINRAVRLVALPQAEVTGVFVETVAIGDHTARLRAHISVDGADEGLTASISVRDSDGGHVVAGTAAVTAGSAIIELGVDNPKLWWPRGYGAQHLYTATAEVSSNGDVLDTATRSVGIRQVELLRSTPTGRPTFQFVINGTPIYVRGTNYIPVDYLKVFGTPDEYQRVFALLEAGNNNLVRMWGGGATESHEFYDECDRRGILLWQDFYLHSNMYPDYDAEWVAEFTEEVRQLAVQAREHACLVILCGGNEQREGWEEWQWRDLIDEFWGERLVTEVIPKVLESIPTGVPYVDNSPHGGRWSQSPVAGESHIWGNHFNSTKDPLFVTETCWGQESYSRPETLEEVMGMDLDAFSGKGWPLKWKERTELPVLTRFPYTNYHNTGGVREYIQGLEAEQALADYHSMGNFRLHSPSCRGMVYWSFNKGGPLFQFGAVDYKLRPMWSFYVLARLYKDVVVGAYRDNNDVRVVASNALPQPVDATLEVVHIDGRGKRLGEWTRDVRIESGAPQRLLDLPGLYDGVVDRTSESVYARLLVDGVPISGDQLLFAPISEFLPPEAELDVSVERVAEGEWVLTARTSGVVKSVQITHSDHLILEDNHFPLVAGFPHTVRVRSLGPDELGDLSVAGLESTGDILSISDEVRLVAGK